MKSPILLNVQDPKERERSLRHASKIIGQGGLVAFPTESFYGLAVDPENEESIRRLFKAKQRPEGNPILLLIAEEELVHKFAEHVPETASRLIKQIWPGRVTLVFRARDHVSSLLTGGTGKIGLRLSSNSVARALAGLAGGAITGTSANISSKTPCLGPADVLEQLGNKVDAILDGGQTPGGPGTTIVDVTGDRPRIIREGMVPRVEMEKYICLSLGLAPKI